jgi:hypothetical protein
MPRKRCKHPTGVERRILNALWRQGPGSAGPANIRHVVCFLALLMCVAIPIGVIHAKGKSSHTGEEAPESQPATIVVVELDNPLRLDSDTLIKLFRAGGALRGAAYQSESFYHQQKRLPKSIAELYRDHLNRADLVADPFAPGAELRITLDPKAPDVVRIWSVGPDGDWDGGCQIDSANTPLDGDLGAEMRLKRPRFRWLADKTFSMHLQGHRLAHYLAIQGPKLPKPAWKDDGLAWGPEVDGLRAAAELSPKKDAYALGEKIALRFHIRNASDRAITIASDSWLQQAGPDAVIVEDERGQRLRVGHTWYSGMTPTQRETLEPGQTAIFASSGLAFIGPGAEVPGHPVGHRVTAPPGRYTIRFTLRFPDGFSPGPNGIPRPTDWQGALETATAKLRVEGQDKPPQAKGAPPEARAAATSPAR